jgi:hypothetical protein
MSMSFSRLRPTTKAKTKNLRVVNLKAKTSVFQSQNLRVVYLWERSTVTCPHNTRRIDETEEQILLAFAFHTCKPILWRIVRVEFELS